MSLWVNKPNYRIAPKNLTVKGNCVLGLNIKGPKNYWIGPIEQARAIAEKYDGIFLAVTQNSEDQQTLEVVLGDRTANQ